MKISGAPEIQWLLKRAKPLIGLQLAGLSCTTAGSVLTLADPLIMKWLIDSVIPGKQLVLLLMGVLGFAALYLVRLALTYCGVLLNVAALQKLTFRIRTALVRALRRLSAKEYERHHPGELLYRIEQDVGRIGELGGDILPNIARMVVVAAVVMATMCVLNRRLTALVLPLLPCLYFVQRKHHRRLLHSAEEVQQQSGKTSSVLQEHLTGMMQLALLNRQEGHARAYARCAAKGATLQIAQRVAEIRFSSTYLCIVILGSTAILGYGGYEVTKGELTIGGLVAFYSYVTRLFEPLMIAVDLQSRIQRVTASVQRIAEIENVKSECQPSVRDLRLRTEVSPDIEFRHVHFSHGARGALHDVTFRIEAGEKTVIVGRSGSGKSTLANLAAGLYAPDAGAILIGSHDVSGIDRRNLRSVISLVPQDPVFFEGTLRENLFYGNPSATAQDIDKVLLLARLHTLLGRLPKGMDEHLGPMGSKLSGGEKKRLALARAMLQCPRVLVLDEITAALDRCTAEQVLQGIDEFRANRTVIVISHKPTTIRWADKVVVLHEGRVVDTGPHGDLMQRCSLYQKLICNQESMSIRTSPLGDIPEIKGAMPIVL